MDIVRRKLILVTIGTYRVKRFAGILAGRCGSVRVTYGRTSRYGHLSITDSFQCPDKILSDNGHCLGPREQMPINLTSLLLTLRWSGASRIPTRWICTGWIPSSLDDELCKVIKSLVAVYQTAICERCTEEHNRLFEGFNNYRYSIKIFSITFCTLVTVYCTFKIAKDVFRIVLYVTTFYKQHWLRCSSFRFKTVICL